MFFRRKQAKATEGTDPPEPLLRDELGFCPLWYWERRLREELARAARSGAVFSLAAWQLRLLPGEKLDGELLHRCSQIVMQSLRTYDLATRLEEHRLVALLFDSQAREASTVAHRIKSELQLRVASAGRWQAGTATFRADGVDADSLIQVMLRRLEGEPRAA